MMYDSIDASISLLTPLDHVMWDGGRTLSDQRGAVGRWWRHGPGGLRVQYRRALSVRDSGLLSVSFSIPHVLMTDQRVNITDADKERALDLVDAYLDEYLPDSLPSVRGWRVQRVDYAWNWSGVDVPAYIAFVAGLSHGTMSRTLYPTAVRWLSSSRHGRTVTMYDKDAQAGDGLQTQTLRYEVANGRGTLKHMCEKWFGCDRIVSEVLQPGRSLYVLARSWSRLGLDVVDDTSDAALMARLRAVYGTAAAPAYYHLRLMEQYGLRAVSLGYTTQNTYYTWRRRLRAAGFVANNAEVIVPEQQRVSRLSLPFQSVFSGLWQNLEKKSPGLLSLLPPPRLSAVRWLMHLHKDAPVFDLLVNEYEKFEQSHLV